MDEHDGFKLQERGVHRQMVRLGLQHDMGSGTSAAFKKHLDSLESNPAYGVLLPKQVRHNIEDQVLANPMALLQL